jgi:periplasmic protein TonB
MKTPSHPSRAAGLLSIGLLTAFTGCTSTSVRQATSETPYTPTFSAPSIPGDAPPKPLHTVKPDYPFDMKRAGLSGIVTLSCLVDEQGRVRDALVEKTPGPSFGASALEAIRQWTFTPAIRNGTPVAVRVTLPMNFVLSEQ